MPRLTSLQPVKEAMKIARDHGCYVIEKGDRYLVYRKTPARPVFLGYRTTPEALRAFVRKLTNFH